MNTISIKPHSTGKRVAAIGIAALFILTASVLVLSDDSDADYSAMSGYKYQTMVKGCGFSGLGDGHDVYTPSGLGGSYKLDITVLSITPDGYTVWIESAPDSTMTDQWTLGDGRVLASGNEYYIEGTSFEISIGNSEVTYQRTSGTAYRTTATVVFDTEGGSPSIPDITKELTYQVSYNGTTTIQIPDVELTRNGYTFEGWAENYRGPATYDPGETIRVEKSERTVLHAIWSDRQIDLDPNGGSGGSGSVAASDRMMDVSDVVLPQRDGYELAGWTMAPDDLSSLIPASVFTSMGGISGNLGNDPIFKAQTWYAYWVPEGTLNEIVQPSFGYTHDVYTGQFVTFAAEFADFGSTTIGWMDMMGGFDACMFGWDYCDGTGGTITSYSFNVTVNAYTPSYTVRFISNGSVYDSIVIEGSGFAIAPSNPELYRYTFGGWFIDNGTFLNEWDFSDPITHDLDLYAKWTGDLQFTTDPVSDGVVKQIDGQPGTVSFRATDSLYYSSVLWDFGEGTTSTDLYATHYYSEPGTYTASLTVYNNHGSDVTTYQIEVPSTDPGGDGTEWALVAAVVLIAFVSGALIARRLI